MSQPEPPADQPKPSKLDELHAEREALLAQLDADPDYRDPHADEVGDKARTSDDDSKPAYYTDPDEVDDDLGPPIEVEPQAQEPVITEPEQVSEPEPQQQAQPDPVGAMAKWLQENNPQLTLEQALNAAKAAQKATEPETPAQAEEKPASPNLEQLEARRDELRQARKEARASLDYETLNTIEAELDDLTENLMPAARAAEAEAAQRIMGQFEQSAATVRDLYPEATNANSALYKRMEEIDAALEANGDPLFNSPEKPLRIAQMAARELNIAPKAKAGPAAKTQPTRTPHMTAPLKAAAVRPTPPNPSNQLEDEISSIRTPEQYEAMRQKLMGR